VLGFDKSLPWLGIEFYALKISMPFDLFITILCAKMSSVSRAIGLPLFICASHSLSNFISNYYQTVIFSNVFETFINYKIFFLEILLLTILQVN